MLRLNLGCRNKKIHGFTNVDICPSVNPDLVDDAMKLEKIENNSVDLIYSSHMAEHFSRAESLFAFKRWYEVLKKHGRLYISVPDLEKIFKHYVLHEDLKALERLLYGDQSNDYEFHRTGWDFTLLKRDLESVGFKNVKRYDRWKTDWSHVDDFSAAYLPHMDFKNGTLMSLNVECIKE